MNKENENMIKKRKTDFILKKEFVKNQVKIDLIPDLILDELKREDIELIDFSSIYSLFIN